MCSQVTKLSALVALSSALAAAQNATPLAKPQIEAEFAHLPLAFEKNLGQAGGGFDFLAHGANYDVFLSRSRATIAVRGSKAHDVVNLRFTGSLDGPAATPQQPLPGKVNYLIGNDPAKWRTDISTYQRVEYGEVYAGVRLAYHGSDSGSALEYDFILAPGADAGRIRMKIDGASNLKIDPSGDLILGTASGPLRFHRPVSYQRAGSGRREIASRWVLDGAGSVRFSIGGYDRTKELVIDPTLVYSTRLGGLSGPTYMHSIAADATGSTYVTGSTPGNDFPLKNPEQASFGGYSAIFVSKLAANGGSLIYSTYFGGSDSDQATGIAVDSRGQAHVAGYTNSTDFPLKNPLLGTPKGLGDAFVSVFNAAGNGLIFSTYLGGSCFDYAYGIAVDSAGDSYVTGQTCSTDFPTTPGAYLTANPNGYYESFVTKLNPTGTALGYSTYFGDGGSAIAQSIAVKNGAAYIAGETYTSSFPATAGAAQTTYGGNGDSFVGELNAAGNALVYATYIGGSQQDYTTGIAVDSSGAAYVAGDTLSSDFPVTPGTFQHNTGGGSDGFVTKVNGTGSHFVYSSYLGGFLDEFVYGITVDASKNAILTGQTYSGNFPLTAALQPQKFENSIGLLKTANGGTSWTQSALQGEPQAISFDSMTPANLVVTTDDQVVFYSPNGGTSWATSNPMIFANALARSPSNPAVVYAGGCLVYSSTDGGHSFSLAGNAPGNCANQLVVDPLSSATVYALAYNTIGRSTDGGVTWTGLTVPGGGTFYLYDLAINPVTTSTLYCATSAGLYRSTDVGNTWTLLNIGGYTAPYVSQVLINPNNPSTIYADVSGSVWKSMNGGTSWTKASSGLIDYANSIAISASTPSTLYAVSGSGNVYVTTNSGTLWTLKTPLAPTRPFSVAINPKNPQSAFVLSYVGYTAFAAKVNPAGSALAWSTYLGGSDGEQALAVATNSSGDAFVTGQASSTDFPTTPGSFQAGSGSPLGAAFVARISDRTGPCAYTITPSNYLAYYGTSIDFSVASPSGCAWSATTTDSWIHITASGSSGVGIIDVNVDANPGDTRTGTVTGGGQTATITQAGARCTYGYSSNELAFPQTGGSGSLEVFAPAGCPWSVTNLNTWLTVTSGASGTGNGLVTFRASSNAFAGHRYGYPQVGPNQITADQPGTAGVSEVNPPTGPPAPVRHPRPPFCAAQPWRCPPQRP
jgi:photosystem II stability/assembly factor-like uncharacterized protein